MPMTEGAPIGIGDRRFSRRQLVKGGLVGLGGIAAASLFGLKGVPLILERIETIRAEWAEQERQRTLAFERESTLGFAPSHRSLTGWTVKYLTSEERERIVLSEWRVGNKSYQVYPSGNRPVFDDNYFNDKDGALRDTHIAFGIYTRQDGVSVPSLSIEWSRDKRVRYFLRSRRGNDQEDVVVLGNTAINNGRGEIYLMTVSARPETSELVVRWFNYVIKPK